MDNPYEKLAKAAPSHDATLMELHTMVEANVIKQNSSEVRRFDELCSNPLWKCAKGDKAMNLFEQGGKYRLLKVPKEALPIWFDYYDKCRRVGIVQNWTEKQHEDSSGLRIDGDIYQDQKDSQLNEKIMHKLVQNLITMWVKLFQMPREEFVTHVVVSRRTAVTPHDEKKAFKDGFHIDIPGLRTNRVAKRFFLFEVLKNHLISKAFGNVYKDPETIIDTQCCHVPLVLYGSAKEGSTPYQIAWVWNVTFEGDNPPIMSNDVHFARSGEFINLSLEMSATVDSKAVRKMHIEPREQYAPDLEALRQKHSQQNLDDLTVETVNDLNHLTVNDPDAMYLKEVLDILKPQRYNNRKLWFKVIYALCSSGDRFVPLARWFSKKSVKYDEAGFNKAVKDAQTGPRYQLSHETIYYWASRDNPIKFESLNDRSCLQVMLQYVHDSICEGRLGNAHYAEIIHLCLKNKYATDQNGKVRTWYEFKFPQDKHEKGQVYKWVLIQSPDAIDAYIHRKLFELCHRVVQFLNDKINRADDGGLKKYYIRVLKNFRSSARSLWSDGFKTGIIKQTEKLFSRPGFVRELDREPMALGVGQGILVLNRDGRLPRLVKSFNSMHISRYTDTMYKQFDPHDPITRKLLKGMRSMHLDTETDAFEYKMCLKAASIDNRPRESIILLVTGPGSNGKSFEFELHKEMLGEQYCTSLPIAMIIQGKEDNGEAPKPFLMKLEAARAAYYEEGPTCAILNMPMIKRITGCANLPGRQLFGEARNIKSRCYHFVLSNHDFIVTSHEEAVWRRLRYVWVPIIFKDALDFDPKNPRHRLMDRTFNAEFRETDEAKSAYMSIMVFYHMKLMKHWGGVVEHVPHPTIDRQTREFRNTQDTINKFITERIVRSAEQTCSTPLEQIIDKYCNWYDANYRQIRHFKNDIRKQFMDSAIKDMIETDEFGAALQKGYRVLEGMADKKADEKGVQSKSDKQADIKEKKYKSEFKPETPDEYLLRVENEWKELLEWSQTQSSGIDMSRSYIFDEEDLADDDLTETKDEVWQPDIKVGDVNPETMASGSDDDDESVPFSQQIIRTMENADGATVTKENIDIMSQYT